VRNNVLFAAQRPGARFQALQLRLKIGYHLQ
jgi:hypothetical protein